MAKWYLILGSFHSYDLAGLICFDTVFGKSCSTGRRPDFIPARVLAHLDACPGNHFLHKATRSPLQDLFRPEVSMSCRRSSDIVRNERMVSCVSTLTRSNFHTVVLHAFKPVIAQVAQDL